MPPTTDSRQDEGEDSTPSSTQDREKPSIRTDQLIKLKQAKQKGRGIRRLVTLCGTITQLMVENNNRSADGEANDDVDNGNSPERKEEIRRRRNRNYQSYLQLIKLIPSLKPRVGTDPNELDSYAKLYYAQLLEGANNARSGDISRVKSGIAILLNIRSENPINPPLDSSTRNGRGLRNDFVGRLLCPIKYNWSDPVVRARLREKTSKHNTFSDYWIRCLYEGEEGDPEDVEKGFLKSKLLVKTFQMIFTSPSSAQGDLDARVEIHTRAAPTHQRRHRKIPFKRPPVATQLQMDGQVTARAIAYTAVQLHFALNDATRWTSYYDGFNYEEFYEFIIDFLEEDQTPEGKAATNELFNWWNRCVFPRSAPTRESRRSARRTSLAVARRQRQARRQAAAS